MTRRPKKKLDEYESREQYFKQEQVLYERSDPRHKPVFFKEKWASTVNTTYNHALLSWITRSMKAFDSVQTHAILTSLQGQGIEYFYIEILKDIHGQRSYSTANRVRQSISI